MPQWTSPKANANWQRRCLYLVKPHAATQLQVFRKPSKWIQGLGTKGKGFLSWSTGLQRRVSSPKLWDSEQFSSVKAPSYFKIVLKCEFRKNTWHCSRVSLRGFSDRAQSHRWKSRQALQAVVLGLLHATPRSELQKFRGTGTTSWLPRHASSCLGSRLANLHKRSAFGFLTRAGTPKLW